MARKLYLHVKVKEVIKGATLAADVRLPLPSALWREDKMLAKDKNKGATLAADVRLPLPSALWRKDKMLAKAPIAQLMHAFRLRC